MTLLLASIRNSDVLLTADSRATLKNNGAIAGFDDHYQKLFPIPEHPVVIAHHGENILDHKPVAQFVSDFVKQLNTGNHTIEEIADEFRCYAHPAVRARLRALDDAADGRGFWIAGFSAHEKLPSLIELFWLLKGNTLSCEECRSVPTCVLAGGNGQHQIPAVDWHRVQGKPAAEVRAYHRSLMETALRADVKPNSVGGTPHEVRIDREKWTWTLPPPRPVPTQPASS